MKHQTHPHSTLQPSWLTVDAGSLTLAKSSGNAIPRGALIIGDGLGGADADVVWETDGLQIGTIPITINSSGWLNLDAQNDMVGSLHFNGGRVSTTTGLLTLWGDVTVAADQDRQARLEGRLALTATHTFNVINSTFSPDLMISATISGVGGILKTGSGALGLCGANTFQGLVTVRQSLLYVYHGGALGTDDSGTVVESGGVLVLANDTRVASESLTLNGNGDGTMGALSSVGGSIWWGDAISSWAGPITLATDSSLYVPGRAFLNLLGPISGRAGFTKTGPGTLIFSGSSINTYSGKTRMDEGTLLLAKSIRDAAVPGDLIIGDGVGGPDADVVRLGCAHQIARNSDVVLTNTGFLDLSDPAVKLSGHAEGLDGLSGVGHVHLGTNTLAIGVDGASSIFAGTITDAVPFEATTSDVPSAVIGGEGGRTCGRLGKHGTGTFVLNGTNQCHGETMVWSGELVVNGAQPFSPVGIVPSATLSGTGTVGTIISYGGTVSPGFLRPGTLTGRCLGLFENSTYHVDLAGQPPSILHDHLNITGELIYLDEPNLTLNDAWVPVYGQRFVIINNDSPEPVIGQFRDLPNGAVFKVGLATYQIRYDGGDGNDIVLEVVALPLQPVDVQVSTGNGNGFIDPNECNLLHIVLTNTTTTPVAGIRTELATTSPHALVHQAVSNYPDIPPGGCATNLTPFQLSTLPTLPCGAHIGLELIVTSAAFSPFVVTPELPLGPSGIPVRIDNDADLSISDLGETVSTMAVSGFDAQLTEVQVSVHITHTAVGDLSLSLVGPDGTSVALSRARGGTSEDYGTSCDDAERTWFGDSAALSIGHGIAPFLGLFRPEEPLAVFRGKHGAAVNGTWELRMEDRAAGTLGSLRCWSLFLLPPECPDGGGICMPCPNQVIRGTITSSDPRLQRVLAQDGQASICGTRKPCLRASDVPADERCHYDVHPFQNGASTSCVTVELVAPESPGRLFSAAYRDQFDPANPFSNYLADAGSAGSSSCLFRVGPGAVFVVVVMDLAWSRHAQGYELRISGGSCLPWLDIRPAPDNQVVISWPTFARDFHLDVANTVEGLPDLCTPVTERPVVIGSAYTVTNTCTSPIRFYQLHKP